MEWVKLYTRMPRDPAIRAAQARCSSARDLFVLGLCYVGEQETDGLIPASEPAYWQVARWKQAADALVAEGLWEPLLEGGWRVARWTDLQVTRDTAKARRASNARRQALHRDPELKAAIRARDLDLCRYCGIIVTWGKGRAPDSGSFDHVDPAGPNSLENLVVACVSCNSAKCDRTPAQAGMTVLPVGTSRNASRNASRVEESRGESPLPPQAGARRSACERHKARPKDWCEECRKPAPTRPAETRLSDLCDLHGRDAATCPFCPQLPLEEPAR